MPVKIPGGKQANSHRFQATPGNRRKCSPYWESVQVLELHPVLLVIGNTLLLPLRWLVAEQKGIRFLPFCKDLLIKMIEQYRLRGMSGIISSNLLLKPRPTWIRFLKTLSSSDAQGWRFHHRSGQLALVFGENTPFS